MPITEGMIRFMLENRFRNDRQWYLEHKDEYRKLVVEPLAELVGELTDTMKSIDPLLVCEPKIDRTISRIYRDTRFSNDKSLYRDVAWIVFTRDRKAFECPPGFVLEISPAGFRYGCGWYSAPPKFMEEARRMILAGDKTFLAAKKACESQKVFEFQGDTYKRARYPEAPEDLKPWLERKNFDWMRDETDFSLLFSDKLAGRLKKHFPLLAPVYRFFVEIEENLRK